MSPRATWILMAAGLIAVTCVLYIVGQPVETEPPAQELEIATPHPIEVAVVPPIAPEETPAAVPEDGVIMTREVPGEPGEPPLLPALPLQRGELPWEKRLREIVSNEKISDSDKARLLLDLLPSLPVQARETAAEQAAQLVPDGDYRIAHNVLLNPATYPPALAALWSDLMQRPDEIALPSLLIVARNPSHPYAATARENLELLLGRDLGTNWTGWETAIREHLSRK